MSQDPIYKRWRGMLERCENKKHKHFANYGGRGISVCKDWHSIKKFKEWALENGFERHLELDRIDNSKGYEPNNCRFVTPQENLRNRRPRWEWNRLRPQEYLYGAA